MLILNRKSGQSIILLRGEEQIEITIIEVKDKQVRLGIIAPPEVRIVRRELWEREQSQG